MRGHGALKHFVIISRPLSRGAPPPGLGPAHGGTNVSVFGQNFVRVPEGLQPAVVLTNLGRAFAAKPKPVVALSGLNLTEPSAPQLPSPRPPAPSPAPLRAPWRS